MSKIVDAQKITCAKITTFTVACRKWKPSCYYKSKSQHPRLNLGLIELDGCNLINAVSLFPVPLSYTYSCSVNLHDMHRTLRTQLCTRRNVAHQHGYHSNNKLSGHLVGTLTSNWRPLFLHRLAWTWVVQINVNSLKLYQFSYCNSKNQIKPAKMISKNQHWSTLSVMKFQLWQKRLASAFDHNR